jgi:hypothetical protein
MFLDTGMHGAVLEDGKEVMFKNLKFSIVNSTF